MQSYETELVDLVDEQGSTRATCYRSKVKEYPELYLPIVQAFLINKEGKLCFMRRADSKECNPSLWSIVGGAAQSAEPFIQSMIREIEEEINLQVSENSLEYLGVFKDHENKYMKHIFQVRYDNHEIQLNYDDFSEYCWLFPHELSILEKKGTLSHDLPLLIKRFYLT